MPTAALHSYFWSGAVIGAAILLRKQVRVPDMWGFPSMNFYSMWEKPPTPFMFREEDDNEEGR